MYNFYFLFSVYVKLTRLTTMSTANQTWYFKILIFLLLLGNKTLCEICNSKAMRKAMKKKPKEIEEEEGAEEGTAVPYTSCRPFENAYLKPNYVCLANCEM